MTYRVLPYRQGSKSARALAVALGGKLLKLSKLGNRPFPIINWGHTQASQYTANGLNGGDLRSVTNKRLFFESMTKAGLEDIIPAYWTSAGDIPEDAYPIVCRTVLAGHSGEGIVLAYLPSQIVPAPLYVRYIKKKDEYRIHVGRKGDQSITIAVQRKARRLDCHTPNWQVRNLNNGFVYVREDAEPPNGVVEVAHDAFINTVLDFGAVDVIYNEEQGKAYVLEINTAPGLEGTTVENYRDFFLTN